jgi:hypothetical protein
MGTTQSSQVMNVFIVMLEDPYASHFCGVYGTREAAEHYVRSVDDLEEIDGEHYTISAVPVQMLVTDN